MVYLKKHIRKMVSILMTIIVMISPLNCLAYSSDALNSNIGNVKVFLDEQPLDLKETIVSAVTDYSEKRVLEFDSINDKVAMGNNKSIVNDEERIAFLEEWKEELAIDIIDVNAEYVVNDVLHNSDECLKISVYEWIWIDYYCKGYDVPEIMGFGTDHILNYKKTSDGLSLCDDSYFEITGFEAGTAEDIALLKADISEDIGEFADGVEQEEILLPMATYSSSAAISYSNTWCGNTNSGTSVSMNPKNYNPSYYYYSGADCCNFVSQCLKAGGMTMSGTWTATLNNSGTVKEDTTYTKSGEAWRYVPTFVSYWKNKGYTAKRITSSSQAVKGNPIYWLKSDGYSSNHIMLIVGTNSSGQVLINGHNNDAYKYPLTLSAKKYYTLDLVHNYKTVTSYNATTHTLKCTLCDKTMTENHVFASVASLEEDYLSTGTMKCLVCGYTK